MKKILLTVLFMMLMLPCITQAQTECANNGSPCSVTFNLSDSGYDGWDDGYLTIHQGGNLIDTLTLSGSSRTVTLQLCPEPITLGWTPVGRWNYECYFEVVDAEDIVIFSVASLGNTTTTLGVVNISCPTCFSPQNFRSTSNTSTSVALQWAASSTPGLSYEIMYGPSDFSPESTVVASNIRTISLESTATTTTINGLSFDSTYYFYIRNICNSDEQSRWIGPLMIRPGSYKIGTSGNTSITSCGAYIYDNGGVDGNYSAGCDGSITVYPTDSNSLVVISGTLILNSGTNNKLTIYDGTSTSGTVIATFTGNNNTPVTIPEVMSSLGPITIRFQTNYSTSYPGFELRASCVNRPTCALIDNITFANITGTSAMMEWTIMNNLGATPSSFELEISDTNDYVFLSQYSNAQHFLLSGLTPNTKYIAKVRSICESGEYSDWKSVEFETGCLIGGDISITQGTSFSSRFPLKLGGSYSYTQQIYDASELDGEAKIAGIAFNLSSEETQNRTIDVYIGHTSQSSFASANDYIPADSLKLVYSGTFNFAGGWNNIMFDSVFMYNGTSNLVVAVDDNTGYSVSPASFQVLNIASKSIYFEHNSNNPNPAGLSSFTGDKGTQSYRSNVIFIVPCDTAVTCVRPDVYVAGVNGNTVDLVWAPGYNETSWDIEYRKLGQTEWTLEFSGINQTSYTIYDLDYSSTYEIRVSSVCGSESKSYTVSARTDCGAISTLPFMETFDRWTAGNNVALDPCWSRISYSVGASYTYPNVVTSQYLSASNSIQISANASNQSGLILPPFNFDVNTLKLTFSMRKTDATQHGLIIGVITDPTDVSTFTAIDTVDNATNTDWETFEISLENYNGAEGQIAMLLPKTTSGSALRYIDNVIVNELYVNCETIGGITVNDITSTSAVVSWIDSVESFYMVEYGLHGFTAGEGTFDTTSNTSYTINNLTSLSEYDVYIYRICSADDTSAASMVTSFTTTCGEISELPFIENFDTWETNINSFGQCWNRLSNGSVTVYANIKNTQSVSQPNSLYMKCGENNYSVVALPKISAALDSLQISFDIMKTSSTAQNIEIGIMTDPTNAATFNAISTYAVSAASTWEGVQVQFDSYSGTQGHIAIRIPSGRFIDYYIDNVVVDYIPDCMAPTDVVVGDFAENGINVDWTEMGTATQWDVCYGPDGFDVNGSQARIITGITSHPYTIQNLSSDTIYNVYVRSVCGTGNISDWSVSHVTSRASVYNMLVRGHDTISTCSARIYDDGGANGNYSNNVNSVLTIYPSSTGNILTVTGTTRLQEQEDYIKIFDGPDTTYTRMVYVAGNANINCSSSFGPITIKFVSSAGVNYAGIDLNVQCEEVSCYIVQNVAATNITSSTADISWTEIGTATQWEIEYGPRGFAHGSGESVIANSTTHTITNMTPATQYDVYVRAVCGTDDASQWQMIHITTSLCDNPTIATIGNGTRDDYQIPFYPHYAYSYCQQIFTADEMGMNANGLSSILSSISLQYTNDETISRQISIYMAHTSDSVFTSSRGWIQDSSLQLVYSGAINWSNTEFGNWVEIMLDSTFTYNGHDNLVVAIADNTGSDMASYQINRFYTHTANGNKTLYYNTDNGAVNVSSPGAGSLSSYRNNVKINSCETVCEEPGFLSIVTDRSSATLTWNTSAATIEVSYKKTSENDWSNEIAVSNTNTYTITTLQPETSYDFRIRKVCDSAAYSEWVMERDTTLAYPCATPTAIQATDITYSTAVISWDATADTAEGWIVAYGYGTDAITWDTVTVYTNSIALENMYPSIEYTVYVQRVCDFTIGVYSEWSEAYTFTTLSCEGVETITASEITTSTATITWTPAAGQTKWELSYGMQGVDEEHGTKVVVENNPVYTIEGLESGFTYDVYVRNICDEGVYSVWSSKFQFTTHVGINTAAGDNVNVRIYPNPANTEATIAVEGINGKVEFAIADMNGRMIVTETINCDGQLAKTIDVSNLAKGAYFVHIYNDNFNTTRKLIVK